jgi:hypothetical protein
LYFIRPQWDKIKNQQQEKLQKIGRGLNNTHLNDQWVIEEIGGEI